MAKQRQSKLYSANNIINSLLNIDLDRIGRGRKGNEENMKIIITVPLLEALGYEKTDMDFEHPLLRNKRADIAVFLNENDTPDVLVETKRLDYPLDDAIVQALNYAYEKGINLVVLSNGRETRLYQSYIPKTTPKERLRFSCNLPELKKEFKKLNGLLGKNHIVKIIKKEKIVGELLISDKKFEIIVQECRDIMRNAPEKSKTGLKAFIEFNKLLFIKIYEDEKGENESIYERMLTVKKIESKSKNYVNGIFKDHREFYKNKGVILFESEEIDLSKPTISGIVALFEPYNLHRSAVSAKGKVYEKFIDETFRGEEGQYFTPRTIVDFMVKLVGVQYGEKGMKILDPACGSGGFIITSFEQMKGEIDRAFKNIKYDERGEIITWEFKNKSAQEEWESALKNLKYNLIYGFDKNEDLAATTRMNMILHGDGSSNVFYVNSLDKDKMVIPEKKFDTILTNPPFGITVGKKNKDTKKVSTEEKRILKQYILSQRKCARKIRKVVECVPQARDSQILFLERCIDLLEDDGLLCTVIDEGVLNNLMEDYVREYIREKTIIKAIISLPEDTFKSKEGGAKASILLLKKKAEGLVQGKVFAAIPDHVGIKATGEKDIDLLPDVLKVYESGKWENESPLCFSINPKYLTERLDAKFFKPEFLKMEKNLKEHGFGTATLDDLTSDIKAGKTPGKNDYLKGDNGDCTVVVKVATIGNYGIDWDEVAFAPQDIFKTEKGRILEGDVLMICSAHSAKSIGSKIDIVEIKDMPKEYVERVRVCGELMIVRSEKEFEGIKIQPMYILAFLKSQYGQKQIERVVRGQTAHIYSDDMKDFIVPLPKKDTNIQSQIVHEIKETRIKVRELQKELSKVIKNSVEYINNKMLS